MSNLCFSATFSVAYHCIATLLINLSEIGTTVSLSISIALTLPPCTEGGPSWIKLQNTFTVSEDNDTMSVNPVAHASYTLIKHAAKQV